MKVYYAHHLFKYNTQVEQYELYLIKNGFPYYEIINPNGGLGYNEEDLKTGIITEAKIIQICLNAIKDCNALVFSSMNGVIGKGVFDEVNYARKLGKPVYYLHENELILVTDITYRILDESRRVYAVPIVNNIKTRE